MLAQAKVMKLFHQMVSGGKIGPALNLTAMYQESSRPEDAIAAHNWEVLRCWNFADVPVFGSYHPLAWEYMKDRGIAPELQPGDIECLKDAKPDFIAMNYYSTATIAASRGDASDVAARQVISRLCWENRGYIVRGKIRMWEKHSTDGL